MPTPPAGAGKKPKRRSTRERLDRLAENVLSHTRIGDLVADSRAHRVPRTFDIRLDPAIVLPVADQRSSGRCWIFAFTALLRRSMVAHYGLDPSFQLSQKFVQIYDRLEKCNALLETYFFMRHRQGLGPQSLEMVSLRGNYLGDGGTWAFFVRIVAKYGIVPQEVYPENLQSGFTGDLRVLLGRYLLGLQTEAHQLVDRATFLRWKKKILRRCLRIMVAFWGAPPSEFVWARTTGEREATYTPRSFYENVVRPAVDPEAFVVLIHDPRHPFHRVHSVELSHNVLPDGTDDPSQTPPDLARLPTNLYYNVPAEELAGLVLASLRANVAVPFAADVEMFMRAQASRMDLDLRYADVLGFEPVSRKIHMYQNMVSGPNHAMLFVGASEPTKDPTFQVENSWGAMNSAHPYLTMTGGWFDHYVGEIIVHRKFLPERWVRAYEAQIARSDILFYPFWDIFGQLAS